VLPHALHTGWLWLQLVVGQFSGWFATTHITALYPLYMIMGSVTFRFPRHVSVTFTVVTFVGLDGCVAHAHLPHTFCVWVARFFHCRLVHAGYRTHGQLPRCCQLPYVFRQFPFNHVYIAPPHPCSPDGLRTHCPLRVILIAFQLPVVTVGTMTDLFTPHTAPHTLRLFDTFGYGSHCCSRVGRLIPHVC